jgi:lipopolysaccharide assembly outer membrane protein LptD (OstA)
MDVAIGTTNVPFPKRSLIFNPSLFGSYGAKLRFVLFFFVLLSFAILSFNQLGLALDTIQGQIHFSADQQIWDRKSNIVELKGHAMVNRPGESISADHIRLNLSSYDLLAEGKATFITSEAIISGELLDFNLLSRLGRIEKGRVTTERFSLRGEKLERVADDHYISEWGDYTTCVDCAPSWSFEAEKIDLRTENYAHFSNVFTRVKDAPSLWIPYLIFPTKTKRQSGLLFPKFSFGSGVYGSTVVLPFFWAINRSADMTFGFGLYSAMGPRFEWEGRYALTHGRATTNFSLIRDKNFNSSLQSATGATQGYRWGLEVDQLYEFSSGLTQYLNIKEVSDNFYPYVFNSDLRAPYEAFLTSKLQLNYETQNTSTYLGLYRYRNLLNTQPGDANAAYRGFDPRTVQVFPRLVSVYRDQMLVGPLLMGGFNFEVSRFTRQASFFDYDETSVPFGQLPPVLAPAFRPGIDPIRTGVRFSFAPKVYSTFRISDVVGLSPSLEYRGFVYGFDSQVRPSSLSRGYFVFQTDLSTQLEKIYDFPEDSVYPKAKHLIRPLLTYSYIPGFLTHLSNSDHPFVNQVKWGQQLNPNKSFSYNYYFDAYDIVPITYTQNNANYFVPLGNSLSYGLTSQWIRRHDVKGEAAPQYQNAVELKAGQAINFLEFSQPLVPSDRRPFTRMFALLNLRFDGFEMQTNYTFYKDLPSTYHLSRHAVSTTTSFVFVREIHQKVLTFDRSLSLSYGFDDLIGLNSATAILRFSISDYLQPAANVSYGFKTSVPGTFGQWQRVGASLLIQSPSQCWRFVLSANYAPGPGLRWSPDFSLNLVGSGFETISSFGQNK